MSTEDFKVRVGVELDDASFTRFKAKIENAPVKLNITDAKKNIDILARHLDELSAQRVVHLNTQEASNKIKVLKEEIRKIGQTNISLNGSTKLEASLDRIADSVDEIKDSLSSLGNGFNLNNVTNAANRAGNAFNNSANNIKGFSNTIENIDWHHTENQIGHLGMAMDSFGFSQKVKNDFLKDIRDINIAIESISTKANQDGSVDFTIKGIDKLGRAVTAIKQVRDVMDMDGNISPQVTKSSVKITQDFKKVAQEAENAANKTANSVEKIKRSFNTNELSSKVEKIKHDFVRMG